MLLVLTLALPAYAQTGNSEITKDDLDAAAQVRRQAAAELFDATALYEENVNQAEELADTLTKLGCAAGGPRSATRHRARHRPRRRQGAVHGGGFDRCGAVARFVFYQ